MITTPTSAHWHEDVETLNRDICGFLQFLPFIPSSPQITHFKTKTQFRTCLGLKFLQKSHNILSNSSFKGCFIQTKNHQPRRYLQRTLQKVLAWIKEHQPIQTIHVRSTSKRQSILQLGWEWPYFGIFRKHLPRSPKSSWFLIHYQHQHRRNSSKLMGSFRRFEHFSFAFCFKIFGILLWKTGYGGSKSFIRTYTAQDKPKSDLIEIEKHFDANVQADSEFIFGRGRTVYHHVYQTRTGSFLSFFWLFVKKFANSNFAKKNSCC